MTKSQAIERLKELALDDDWERAHSLADEVLTEFLDSLGFEDVTEAWLDVGKYYA